jgi:hypothetical protein
MVLPTQNQNLVRRHNKSCIVSAMAAFPRLLGYVAFGTLGFAAVVKFADLNAFSYALWKWKIVQNHELLLAILTILIPVTELTLAGAWVLNVRRRGIAVGTVALLGLFSVAILLNYALNGSVACGCLGNLVSARFDTPAWQLARNGVLILMILTCVPNPVFRSLEPPR